MVASAEEHRTEQRHTTLKGARIVFNGGRSTIDCRVRNMSPRGAKLLVASVLGIPDSFDLLLTDQPPKACLIAWRKEQEIGVEFVVET